VLDLRKSKPVRRKACLILDNRLEPRPSDFVTVTLYPCGEIGFRRNQSRTEVRLPLVSAYRQALSLAAAQANDESESKPVRRRVKRGLLSLVAGGAR
jgi:hypothetical protein